MPSTPATSFWCVWMRTMYGRPYIVRIHTHQNEVAGVDGIIAGFAFVD